MNWGRIVVGIAVLGLVVAALWFSSHGTPTPGTEGQVGSGKEIVGETKPAAKPVDSTNQTPASPGEEAQTSAAEERRGPSGETPKPPQNFGRTQPILVANNVQAQSVLEALKNHDHPERLSAMLPSEAPFDANTYKANPDKYNSVVEPGRVFLTAQPGSDVPAIQVRGSRLIQAVQGSTSELSVKAAPLGPVTFSSQDSGTFVENKLNSITVQTDAEGLATVHFLASSGTLNDVNILVGSPMASGQAHFVVSVEAK